jgi:hypothetical protein
VKKSVLHLAVIATLCSSAIHAAQVKVIDKSHNPASNFLAYTEFELSGEPLAEALGLDLDILDPTTANSPTPFDFSAGIESYEYSEEAMYALNYQSTMGPHLSNGPLNLKRGGSVEQLAKRVSVMANAVGLPQAEVPKNVYPLSLPYMSGSPEFVAQPNTSAGEAETLDITTAKGVDKTIISVTPAYVHDYKTLAWNSNSFDKSINPAAIGAIFLKEVMWSQDFLGGMHITETDEEVEANSAVMDQDGVHSLGVSAADGFNGMMLTEMSIDKLIIMQNQLGYNGKALSANFGPDYSPEQGAIWFPHKIAVSETKINGVNALGKLNVSDARSTLRDTWQMLWPLAEFFAFTDQRVANSGQNPAMLAVFDGAPFAKAPTVNTDNNPANDVVSDDAFSLANNLSNLVFKNLAALHFNKAHGSFVTDYQGKQGSYVQGNYVNSYDAAYSIVALTIYQRAKDALPVGYASADSSSVNLKTPAGKQALSMIKAQADFILAQLITPKGLVADGATLGKKVTQGSNVSLDAQFATIRGLVSAFLATKDNKYKDAARSIYLAVEKHMFDKKLKTWATNPGQATEHTPYTAAAISGGLREAILHLKNEEGEHNPAFELTTLTTRYVNWFSTVINGAMQLAEPIGDTGELVIKGSNNTDTDEDGVQQIIAAGGKYGTAAVMANKVSIQ